LNIFDQLLSRLHIVVACVPDFLDDIDLVLGIEIEASELLVLVGIEREIADLFGVEVEAIECVFWCLGEGNN